MKLVVCPFRLFTCDTIGAELRPLGCQTSLWTHPADAMDPQEEILRLSHPLRRSQLLGFLDILRVAPENNLGKLGLHNRVRLRLPQGVST